MKDKFMSINKIIMGGGEIMRCEIRDEIREMFYFIIFFISSFLYANMAISCSTSSTNGFFVQSPQVRGIPAYFNISSL